MIPPPEQDPCHRKKTSPKKVGVPLKAKKTEDEPGKVKLVEDTEKDENKECLKEKEAEKGDTVQNYEGDTDMMDISTEIEESKVCLKEKKAENTDDTVMDTSEEIDKPSTVQPEDPIEVTDTVAEMFSGPMED